MNKIDETNKWFINVGQQHDAACHLFCFHHAGGGASFFYKWQQYLPASVNVYAVQLPGRETRHNEPFMTNILRIAEVIAGHLITLQKPTFFFGHSLGALLAYEASRIMVNSNNGPQKLFLSAHRSPQYAFKHNQLFTMEDSKFIQEISKVYEGLDERIQSEPMLIELLLPRIKADIQLYNQYKFNALSPLDIPITVFGGDSDHSVSQEELVGWEEQTSACFNYNYFEGGHFYITTHYIKILEIISNEILVALENISVDS